MALFRVFKRVLIPTTKTGVSASLLYSFAVYAKEKVEEVHQEHAGSKLGANQSRKIPELEDVSDNRSIPVTKPSDLPMYDKDEDCDYHSKPKTKVHDLASDVRKKCADTAEKYKGVTDAAAYSCQVCVDTSKDICGKVSDPNNTHYKMAAIAGGGIVGSLLGYRGGIMRKLFLGALGAGTVAAILYPEEAMEVGNSSVCFIRENGKKFAVITYNFIIGKKADKCPGNNVPPPPPVTECPALCAPEPKDEKPC